MLVCDANNSGHCGGDGSDKTSTGRHSRLAEAGVKSGPRTKLRVACQPNQRQSKRPLNELARHICRTLCPAQQKVTSSSKAETWRCPVLSRTVQPHWRIPSTPDHRQTLQMLMLRFEKYSDTLFSHYRFLILKIKHFDLCWIGFSFHFEQSRRHVGQFQ